MNPHYASVDLDELSWEDERFVVHSFVPWKRLDASLDRSGILFPPWVWVREDGRYTIVDGFKRLSWLRERGAVSAECAVLPISEHFPRLMLLRIEGKLMGPPLNVAEKAQIISKLAEIAPLEEIAARWLPALDIAPQPEAVEKWSRLAAQSVGLLEAAATGEICERAAFGLIGWEDEARGAALALLKQLRCSASIQIEILERVTEIAIRGGKSRMEVLSSRELREIVDHPRWNHRRKTQSLRDLLYGLRFPRLRAREEAFARDLAAAGLPKDVRLVPPQAFEGERWQLQVFFALPEELRACLQQALELSHSPVLQRLMSSKLPEKKRTHSPDTPFETP